MIYLKDLRGSGSTFWRFRLVQVSNSSTEGRLDSFANLFTDIVLDSFIFFLVLVKSTNRSNYTNSQFTDQNSTPYFKQT